jgi:hypothetical protein
MFGKRKVQSRETVNIGSTRNKTKKNKTRTNTTGVTSGAGTVHPSKAKEINPGLVFGRSLFVLTPVVFVLVTNLVISHE